MPGPAIFTIPPHRAFADALAAGLIARFGGDPLTLARGMILLPNNRAKRAITEAFVRRADNGLLLPRLVGIGDPSLDETLGGLLDPIDEAPVPPAIEPLRRNLILARLIQAEQRVGGAEAMRLAADLGRVLDQLLIEQVDPQRLRRLIDPASEPNLSAHWQASLDALEAILERWPAELARIGRIDLADRRNRLLARTVRRWEASPPAGFVVAAGIDSAAPAISRLLRAISRLPEGLVVFAGLDLDMADEEWAALGPREPDAVTGHAEPPIASHPQYRLKRLLDGMSAGRGEVTRWRWGSSALHRDAPAVRTRAIGNAMTPARFTAKWQTLPPIERRVSGVRFAEFATPAEEAQAIAIALRQALETPGRTAALVTPDRTLARRVAAHLQRWGVEADDSAGRPLSATPPGTLLLALAQAAAEDFAPVALLALLKHPLVRAGESRLDWLDGVRLLDRALRGPRPAPGLAGVASHLGGGDGPERQVRQRAQPFWAEASALLATIERPGDRPLGEAIGRLREAATALAGDSAWSGPAGREAATLIADLEASAADGPATVTPDDVQRILRQLLDGVAVRPPQGGHPRIFIWGLIEARLQHADLMIAGGLNEGVWPALPTPDPWLAPRIRATLGLPTLESGIGLAGHDFAMALGAPRVLVTRSRRDARSPALASRFWLRIEAMTGGATRAPLLARWARAIDRPAGPATPAGQPMPAPPIADRPRRIAVTKLDRLKADPFAFYADAMMGLRKIEMVDAEPGPAWRGSAVHGVFEAWMRDDDCDPAKLLPRAKAMLDEVAQHPVLRALWAPRLIEAVEWVAQTMAENLATGRKPILAERFGEAEVAGITLFGKVDRIDRLADGGLAIVDYKTGKPPSKAQVAEGFAMQLGLLGLIAERGGFKDVAGVPSAFEYWSLSGKSGKLGYVESPVIGRTATIAPEDFTARAATVFTEAAARWLTGEEPFTAKLHPELAPYPDYDQLMRLEEWYGRG